jgi:hypothetical protein
VVDLDAYLILGCNPNVDPQGFQYCGGTHNAIIDFSEIVKIKKTTLLDFLDEACRLFDSPEYNYNACVNIVTMLYRDYECFDENYLHKLQQYFRLHKSCGVYIMLMTKEDYNNVG